MLTMYDLTIPSLKRGLGVLNTYLETATSFVDGGDTSEKDLLSRRLAPDMLPLSAQIQRASDNAKNGAARLASVSAPSFPDDEQSIRELKSRIANTIQFLTEIPGNYFEGSDEREVQLSFASVSGKMTGQTYLVRFLLPNFFFHVATAHGILRQAGLQIGKKNYLGPLDFGLTPNI